MASTPSDRTPASKEGLHTPSEAGSATQTLAGGLPKDEEKGYTSKGGSPSFNATTKLAFSKLIPAGISLQLVFWICALWLFGTLYNTSTRAHNLHIAVVDFDGGSVGSALLAAVASSKGLKTAPTYHVLPANSTSLSDLHHRVFQGHYWASIAATSGATDRFTAALSSDTSAASYNASDALVYSGLEVRYNTAWSGFVLVNLNKVVAATSSIFNSQTVAPLLTSGTAYSAAASAVLVNPIGSTFANLTPFAFGTRIVLNTLSFVFPSLFCFFGLMALNSIGGATGWYKGMSFARHIKFRLSISIVWTLLAALSVVGWYLMFDETYNISFKNFIALWAIEWVLMLITFDLLDAMTAYVPPQFLSHLLGLYIMIVSVSAVLWPIELMNKFFRVQYAFPAHAVWAVMITILGKGAVNTLHYNLPILAGWLIVGKVLLFFSLKRRARQGREVVIESEADH